MNIHQPEGGESIERACLNLAHKAPAVMRFGPESIRVFADPGDGIPTVIARYRLANYYVRAIRQVIR